MSSGVTARQAAFSRLWKHSNRGRNFPKIIPGEKKEIFLPNFNVALIRSPRLEPHQAQFKVPLWFSKFDLKDYLQNVYNVGTGKIRSYVSQRPVQQGTGIGPRPQIKRWHRPRAMKIMTAQLDEPFYWPKKLETDEELADWDRTRFKQMDENQKEYSDQYGTQGDTWVDKKKRESLREQAKLLLEGKKKWAPPGEVQLNAHLMTARR